MKRALPKHLLRRRIHVFAGQQRIFFRHCLLHDAHCLRQQRTPIFNSVPTSCLPKTLTDHSPSIRTKPRISPGIRRVARPPQAHIIAPIAIKKKLHGSLCPVDDLCRWYFFGYNRAAYVKMSSVYSKQSTRLGCHASHRLGSSVFGSAFGFGSRGAIRDAVVSATTACFEKCGTKIMVQMENPKKLGSKAWDRFEKYKHARSIGEATQAGANWQDVSVDFEKG